MLKQRAIPKTVPTGLKDTFISVYVYESFSMQMYIRSAKTYGFCMFACLVLMSALLSCLQKCMLSSDIKSEYRQNICVEKNGIT